MPDFRTAFAVAALVALILFRSSEEASGAIAALPVEIVFLPSVASRETESRLIVPDSAGGSGATDFSWITAAPGAVTTGASVTTDAEAAGTAPETSDVVA